MFCHNCGTQISQDSKFCFHCGQKIAVQNSNQTQQMPKQEQRQTDIPRASATNSNEVNRSTQSNTSSATDSVASTNNTETNKKSAKHFVLGVLGFVLVFILLSIIGVNSEPAYSSNYQFTSNSSDIRPEQKKIRKAITDDILYNVEDTLKNDLKLPDTAQIKHDISSWNLEDSLFTFGGTITRQNKEGLDETEPFILKLYISEKKLFRVYAKLGSETFYDVLSQYSTMGVIKNSDTDELDLRKNMEGKLLTIHDKDYEKATLEEFQRIRTGMTYAEVCDIIGSLGTLSGQSGGGVSVYTWVGNGDKDSQAIITFTGKNVFLTTQVGLK